MVGGGASLSWKDNIAELAKYYDCIALDFPGFGVSGEPSEVWGVHEYGEFLESFRKSLNLRKFILIGKSFGGRVAIVYAAKCGSVLDKLILVAAAGLEKKSIKARVMTFFARTIKVLSKFVNDGTFLQIKKFFYKIFRLKMEQNSYKRRIKSVIINQDLSAEASEIDTPTLIVWGSEDRILPLKIGKLLSRKIKGSKLSLVQGADHFAHENHPEEFNHLLLDFLLSE